jgi:FolB domain-containing protein
MARKRGEPSRPLDIIHIRDLRVLCVIGVRPEERRRRQEVSFDIDIWADLSAACESDDLADTVDYSAVKHAVLELAESSSCNLVEHLAELAAQMVLSFAGVERVRVEVHKPGALSAVRTVGVEIVRRREDG